MLNVADNSSACHVVYIKVPSGSYRHYTGVNDIIKITIREAILRGKVKRGDAPKTMVARTEKGVRRPDGSVIRFDGNTCVPPNNDSEQSIGTRILGPVTRKLRSEKLMKIILLAPEVL